MNAELLKGIDWIFLKRVTDDHAKCFQAIADSIPVRTRKGSFIHYLIDDYLSDINQGVYAHTEVLINRYWNESVQAYADDLYHDISNARNAVINSFLLYLSDEASLKHISPFEMKDWTTEYLGIIGSNHFCDDAPLSRINSLSHKQKKQLNYFLHKAGFDGVQDLPSNIIYFDQAKTKYLLKDDNVKKPKAYKHTKKEQVMKAIKEVIRNYFIGDFDDDK